MPTLTPAQDAGKSEPADSPMLAAALQYAAAGVGVFPLCAPSPTRDCLFHGTPKRRKLCKKPGKEPLTPHGHLDATCDETAIRNWWTVSPHANIGIATGRLSRLVVIDIDGDEGWQTLKRLEARHEPLTSTSRVITGRIGPDAQPGGGAHLYFTYPPSGLSSGQGLLGPGLDIRGDTGYVVAPPSKHESGFQYAWDEDYGRDFADLPAWFVAEASARKELLAKSGRDAIPEGQRNSALFSMASADRRLGIAPCDIEALTLQRNKTLTAIPLDEAEARGIARNAAKYEPEAHKLAWMPFYTSAWDGELVVKSGSPAERGMYMCLVVEAWKRQGYLPDDGLLWRVAQADNAEQFEAARDILLSGFDQTTSNGQPVLAHRHYVPLWREQSAKYTQKVEAGRSSAAKRASKTKRK